MNRIDTEKLDWEHQLIVFKALCKNKSIRCNNCPNCAHFEMIGEKIEEGLKYGDVVEILCDNCGCERGKFLGEVHEKYMETFPMEKYMKVKCLGCKKSFWYKG